jgi:hypothetical protein
MISKERFAELALGYTVNQMMVYGFDFGLYPAAIYWQGLGWGFVTMALLSLLVCWLTLKFYDWSKRDWLGIETIKELRDYTGPRRAARWMGWVLRRSDPVACVLLSIKFDPFIVTVYLRHGRYGALTARDWRHFLLSWLIGNAYWAALCFGGVSALRWLWEWVRHSPG